MEIPALKVEVAAPLRYIEPVPTLSWPCTFRLSVIVEVPVPVTARSPVVVAPPLIVRPVVCPPAPMVEDANAVSPALNWVRVEVALPERAKG